MQLRLFQSYLPFMEHHLSPGILGLSIALLLSIISLSAMAEPIMLDISKKPDAPRTEGFKMGTLRSPDGHEITTNSVALLRDGKPWLPVMGEFHYSRYPAAEWRDELLKMKAGGITIVATYVFWIHHEEVEGQFDWTGQRNLREFTQACKEVGLPLVVRCGPWCHGEVRNGGLPDWILSMGRALRSTDPQFLAKVKILYGQIGQQLSGLLWKDGGPVIGIQVDNEFRGRPEYLLTLKQIARDAGLDTPIYTRTGWPNLTAPMPFGEIMPLFGAYAEGFWDKGMQSMPGKYWFAFLFSPIRSDAAIGTDVLGEREDRDEADAKQYPYLCCEIGGGMMNSYHRRVLIDPRDVESVALVKTGSGANLPGYYMYHGGTNPQGKLTTLMEDQKTRMTNNNDMPVKNYDFQAPLGQFGQVRPHYHGLRDLHMFLADWGSELAYMPANFPAGEQHKNDAARLRFAVRSDGSSGFIFVNNYQRLLPMPAKENTQFDLKLADGKSVRVPSEPVTVPADSYFIWPFNLDLGGGAKLIYATAQPICRTNDTVIFAQSSEVAPEFCFDATTLRITSESDQKTSDGRIRIIPKPSTQSAITVTSTSGQKTNILLLSNEQARQCWKGTVGGRERVVLSAGNVIFDNDGIRVEANRPEDLTLAVLENARFNPMRIEPVASRPMEVTLEKVKEAGALRQIKLGVQRVAEQPVDEDFEQAAVYRVKLPAGINAARGALLRLHYTGDVARAYLDGKLLTDDFYNGQVFDLGLDRFAPDISSKELLIKILPLQKSAPIYLAKSATPDFGNAESIEKIEKAEIVQMFTTRVKLD